MGRGLSPAYFISPNGKILYVGTNHIDGIIRMPKKFGLTRDYIKSVYKKYDERLGQEGKAREEIIIEIVNKGWVRIRRYGDAFWSINVKKWNPKIKSYIEQWASSIVKGTKEFKELDVYMTVSITSSDKNMALIKKTNIKDLSLQESFDDYMSNKEKYKLVWINDVSEFDDLIEYKLEEFIRNV